MNDSFQRDNQIFKPKSLLVISLQSVPTFVFYLSELIHPNSTGPRSAVGNVSGHRCVSDCRSRGREFDPGPVPLEIDHEIISTVILLPSAGSFKKGCCQLQAKVCAQITG